MRPGRRQPDVQEHCLVKKNSKYVLVVQDRRLPCKQTILLRTPDTQLREELNREAPQSSNVSHLAPNSAMNTIRSRSVWGIVSTFRPSLGHEYVVSNPMNIVPCHHLSASPTGRQLSCRMQKKERATPPSFWKVISLTADSVTSGIESRPSDHRPP
jgi:hypothetical protein